MSKIFYDHLIILEEVEREIKKAAESPEEREELWRLVDEIVHHRILGTLLDRLPKTHHEEFLDRFHKAPYDESLISYLKENIDKNIEEIIRQEIGDLSFEILKEIRDKKTA